MVTIGLAASLLLAGTLGLSSVLQQPAPNLLQRVQKSGVLVVATRRGPTAYYDGAAGPEGFEYALVEQFADQLGVEVRYVFPPTLEDLLDAAARGTVHLAAAGLTATPQRQGRLNFSNPYDYVTEQLIYRRGSQRPGDRSVTRVSAH